VEAAPQFGQDGILLDETVGGTGSDGTVGEKIAAIGTGEF
jgi:hypothetical protein